MIQEISLIKQMSTASPGDLKGSPDSTDRKKATHLRCERQRREAINVCAFLFVMVFLFLISRYSL